MARLKKIIIEKSHIDDYLEKTSDFTFEIKTLNQLINLGFNCEHGGTYEDPITKKTREFDIRASKRLIDEDQFKVDIHLSVECKNIRDNYPLVIQSVQRSANESYMDLIWSFHSWNSFRLEHSYSQRLSLFENDSPYLVGEPIGKSCEQVGVNNNDEIVANDSSVFDKISQSINAAYSLMLDAHYASADEEDISIASLVVPVLIVPDDKLWNITYNNNGAITNEPSMVPNCEYYIDKSWLLGEKSEQQVRYSLTHLEIVQLGYLGQFIKKYTDLKMLSDHRILLKYFVDHGLNKKN
jgi:hypothetical protein